VSINPSVIGGLKSSFSHNYGAVLLKLSCMHDVITACLCCGDSRVVCLVQDSESSTSTCI